MPRSEHELLQIYYISSCTGGCGETEHKKHEGKNDLHGRLLLDAVAVHVYGFKDALGEVLLLWRRYLGVSRLSMIESFSHSALL
jgi:hypothetical protein